MRLAVMARATVTVESSPSGTFATMIPMAKTRFSIHSRPIPMPMQKKMTPVEMAKALHPQRAAQHEKKKEHTNERIGHATSACVRERKREH